jgi:rhodanese-related sulfurtransferase
VVTTSRCSVIALALCAASGALAGDHDAPLFRERTVAEVVALTRGHGATLVDANLTEFRATHGVIPGAVLLTSYSQYDVARELPADKSTPLIFYCANRMCGASHYAAARAIRAGYRDVSLMPEGLHGWRLAGQPLTPVPQS